MLEGNNVVIFVAVEILLPILTVAFGVLLSMIFHRNARVVARLVPFRFTMFEIDKKAGVDKYVGTIREDGGGGDTLIVLQIVNIGKRAAKDITIELNGRLMDHLEFEDVYEELDVRGNDIPLGYLMPQEKYEMFLTFLRTLPKDVQYSDNFLDIKIAYRDGIRRFIFGKDEYRATIPLKQFDGLILGKFTSKGGDDSWF